MDLAQVQKQSIGRSPWAWAALLCLLQLLIRWLTGCDGLYGQDAYAYLNYAHAIQAHWQSGAALPAFNWPSLYPFLGALWPSADPAPAMQAMSFLGAALLLAMSIRLASARFPAQDGLEAMLFLFIGLAPILLRGSLSIMSDNLALGFVAWALWHGDCYLRKGRGYDLFLASLLAGCAVWTRYPIAILMLVPIGLWLHAAVQRKHWVWILLMLPAGLLAAIPQFLILPATPSAQYGHAFQNILLSQWSFWNCFQRDFVQIDGEFHYTFPNLLASLGMFWYPLYLGIGALGSLGLLFLRREMKAAHTWPYWVAMMLYGLFLAGIPFQNPRFLLPMLPFAAIVFVPAWVAIWKRLALSKSWAGLAFVIVFLVQLGIGGYGSRKLIAASALDRQIVADLNQLPAPTQRLFEFGTEAMLQARGLAYAHESMWNPTIAAAQKGDYVLFNLEAFGAQFADRPPMQHWREFQHTWAMRPLKSWEGGWTVYVLE